MVRWRNKAKQWLINYSDMPADVVMDLPRITIIGQLHIYIENHKGVLSFTQDEVRLALKQGELKIQGKGFVLKTILPEEIMLEGTIEHVRFIQ